MIILIIYMCYSKELSLISFLVGIITSILLIKFGDSRYSDTNKVLQYFIIYISLVQLHEYFIWSDENCTSGLNKISSITLPVIVKLQPVILGFLLNYYVKSDNIISDSALSIINIVYTINALYSISNYLNNQQSICTYKNKFGHLKWNWISNFDGYAYLILTLLNTMNFWYNDNVKMMLIWISITLYYSKVIAPENIGELWCFSSTSTPLIALLGQKLIGLCQ